jgi:hypothetical protein
MWWKIVVCLAIALGLVASTSAVPTSAKTLDPAKVNLVLKDLPTGFTIKSGRYYSNAEAAKADNLTLAQEIKAGRLRSYNVTLQRDGLVGMLNVDSTVVLYTAEKAAAARFRDTIARAKAGGLKEMSLGPLGTEHVGYTTTTKGGPLGLSATGYYAVFYRSRYLVLVSTGGVTNTFNADELYRLAKIVDDRIRAQK